MRDAVVDRADTGSAVTGVRDAVADTGSAVTGATVWLTGLPSAGKSTIAEALAALLRSDGRAVDVLDGDQVRANLSPDLGFSRADRVENVRRIGWVARLLSGHGVLTLVPVIAPYAESRLQVRAAHAESGVPYFEVYVASPLALCVERDVKGLYARQARGELRGLTGVDDPYEPPEHADLVVQTEDCTPGQSAAAVYAALAARGLV